MKRKKLFGRIVMALLLLAALALLLPLISGVAGDLECRREATIKEAVLRSAFQCYSVEGAYPAAMDYLESDYGLMIDHDRYIVSYECYASNRLPEVMVLKR